MIFVDPLCNNGWKLGPNSHLFVAPETPIEDLHIFAQSIGLRRAWFQHKPGKLPHYDVTKGKRAVAVRRGAVELTRAETVEILRKWRQPTATWPSEFSPTMTAMGTALVGVGVTWLGGFPVSGDTYYCLRWVLGFFRVKEGRDVTREQWAEMEKLQNHVFALRDANKRSSDG